MLTTHNFKMLNPDVQQPPLCSQINGYIPHNILCSKNIRLRQYLWRDPTQFRSDNINDLALSNINKQYYENGSLPDYVLRATPLTDQRMHYLNLNLGNKAQGDNFCAVTPAPCEGIFHEIISRQAKRTDSKLSRQKIEVKEERISLHGPMATLHNGTLQVFALPRFDARPIRTAPADKKYVVLEFGLQDFNVATGMIGVGLPAVTVFGTLLTNFVSKACNVHDQLRFAVGLHSASNRQRFNNLNIAGSHSSNHLRKSNLQGYLVIEPETEEQAAILFEVLSGRLKIAGSDLSHQRVIYTDQLPYAYWMHEMNDEVNEFLSCNPFEDVLDAMFAFSSEDRLCVPVPTGFSMLSQLQQVDSVVIRNQHCWVETLFRCTELVYGVFKPKYLYSRHYDGKSTFMWHQT